LRWRNGQPVYRGLAARKPGGVWIVLAKDLTPGLSNVTTGRRRISTTELRHPEEAAQERPEAENELQVERLLGCAVGDSGA